MSGHNKWAQIKRQKGAADAAKSNLWGKLGKRIAVESKKANGDVNVHGLRSIIETAKKANMPKDTIERAIAKGTASDAATLESIQYETYGPGGCAILIQTVTDSRNRTAQEIKHLLSKNGLVLAAPWREPVAATRPAPAEPPARRTPPPLPAPPALSAPPVPLILELRPEVVGDEVQVIIQADGPLAYKSFALDKPSRVVVDFERAQLAMADDDTIEVGNAILRRIRSSQSSPTSVRVVLDLARPRPFWIEPQAEGVVIHLGAARRP